MNINHLTSPFVESLNTEKLKRAFPVLPLSRYGRKSHKSSEYRERTSPLSVLDTIKFGSGYYIPGFDIKGSGVVWLFSVRGTKLG